MEELDRLEEAISKANRIFNAMYLAQVQDIANKKGEEGVRKILREYGVVCQKNEDIYLKCLKEIDRLLNSEQ